MKTLIASAIVAGSLIVANAQAAANSAEHYQIRKVVVTEVQDAEKMKFMADKIDNFTQGCNTTNTPNLTTPITPKEDPTNPIDYIDVIVDKIINIGKKIWAIVDAGRPVVNVKVDTANALPAGVKCWDELEGWNAPTSKLYQISYENGFGASVVSYGFRVSFIGGGSYKGQGKYVTLASVQPANIHVSWGFRLDAVATVPMVFNQGTKADPLAGLQLAMNWKVSSPLTEIQQAENFFVNGMGTLEKMK